MPEYRAAVVVAGELPLSTRTRSHVHCVRRSPLLRTHLTPLQVAPPSKIQLAAVPLSSPNSSPASLQCTQTIQPVWINAASSQLPFGASDASNARPEREPAHAGLLWLIGAP